MPLPNWLLSMLTLFDKANRADFTFTNIQKAEFALRVRNAQPEVVSGFPTGKFLLEVSDICEQYGIATAEIFGDSFAGRISLRFSSEFPPAAQDRLLRWWRKFGWRPVRNQ